MRSRTLLALLIAPVLVTWLYACDTSPTQPAAQVDPVEGAGVSFAQGGKLKSVTAAELGLEFIKSTRLNMGQQSGVGFVDCPAGKVAISGGLVEPTNLLTMTQSWREDVQGGSASRWYIGVQNPFQAGVYFWVWALCVNA